MSKTTQIHRNLHRKDAKWYAVVTDGTVDEYVRGARCQGVALKSCTPSQRQFILERKRRVSQWLRCASWAPVDPLGAVPDGFVRCESDPKKADGFTVDGRRVVSAAECLLIDSGFYVRAPVF